MDASRSRHDASTRREFYLLTLGWGISSTLLISFIYQLTPFASLYETCIFLVILSLAICLVSLWLKPSSLRVVEWSLLGVMIVYDFTILACIMYVGPDELIPNLVTGFLLWASFRFVWAFLVLGPKDGFKVSTGYLVGMVLFSLPYLFGAVPPREADLIVRFLIIAFPIVSSAYLTALYAFAHFLKESVHARAKAEVVAELAYTDALTGLPNRLLFEDRLKQTVSRAEREGKGFALIFVDLDHFKSVNDILGHRAGDLLLKEIGARMKARLRTSDTLARISGDEFAVILHEVETYKAAEAAATTLLSAFDKAFDLNGATRYAGASLGVALYPEHGATPDDLLVHADSAMYTAKERGRCCYQVYHPSELAHSASAA